MKILFLASDLHAAGGVQRYNLNFLESLRGFGADVRSVELKKFDIFSKALFALKFLWRTAIFVPDITVCANLNFSPLTYLAKKTFGREYSISVYGIETVDIKKRMHQLALEDAKFIIVLFENAARNIRRQIPGGDKKLFFLPTSVDGEKFKILEEKSEKIMKRHNLYGKKIILTLGRLSGLDRDYKGYQRVLRVLPEVFKKYPNSVYLLAGGGDDAEETKMLAKKLNIEDRVIFPGTVKAEEMVEYYNTGDIFVLPSKEEGFPEIVLLESLACGVPVVGGDQPGSESRLWHEELGTIVRSSDLKSVEEGILRLLARKDTESLAARQKLRQLILAEYGRDRYLEYVKKFIREAGQK